MALWADPVSTWGRLDLTWTGARAARVYATAKLRGRRTGGSTLAFPMRLDASGRVVTVPQLSPRHAAEIVGHVLSCEPGERGLAPGYGLRDTSGANRISGDLIASTVAACEPGIVVTDTAIAQAADGKCRVKVTAAWAQSVEV